MLLATSVSDRKQMIQKIITNEEISTHNLLGEALKQNKNVNFGPLAETYAKWPHRSDKVH